MVRISQAFFLALVAALGLTFSSASANASTHTGYQEASHVSARAASMAAIAGTNHTGHSVTITGTVSIPSCSAGSKYAYKVQYSNPTGPANWSEVKWMTNPCGLKIQDQSYYYDGSTHTYSGIVKAVGLWARAKYGPGVIASAFLRSTYLNGTWSGWDRYWKHPSSAAYLAAALLPATPTASGKLCMTILGDNCVETHGPGNPLTMTDMQEATTFDFYSKWEQLHVDGSTHCISNGGGVPTLRGCNSSARNQKFWGSDRGGRWTFLNLAAQEYLAVNCNTPNTLKLLPEGQRSCVGWNWN